MSEKNARTLSQPSNRLKPRDLKDKKVAFRGVLDSPYRIHWPSVPLNLQRSILACILDLLEGASDYHHRCSVVSRKRKRACKAMERKGKVSKIDDGTISNSARLIVSEGIENAQGILMDVDHDVPQNEKHDADIEPPIFLRHLLYGLNAITKRLESQTLTARHPNISIPPEEVIVSPMPLKYVFVCRADVNPALLIEHLPHLVAAYNSARPSQHIKLIPLPEGSERDLANMLGIRRVTVLGIDAGYVEDPHLKTLLEAIPTLAASWLSQAQPITPLIQTHIKLLKTTVPKDMKKAKESRLQGKDAAKQKKKKAP